MSKEKARDLSGKRYGHLIAIRPDETYIANSGRRYRRWVCQCDCGNVVIVMQTNLIQGKQKSCGCQRLSGTITHNMSYTRLHRIWANMKDRCSNINAPNYPLYGGKGIKVCDEWTSFEPFMKWALSNGYNETLTIDRIDNSKGYSPDNCRWVTHKDQNNNKTNNINLTYKGETFTLKQWSERLHINYSTLKNRYKKGWDAEKILTVPVDETKSHRKSNPNNNYDIQSILDGLKENS